LIGENCTIRTCGFGYNLSKFSAEPLRRTFEANLVKPKFFRDPIQIQIRFEPADLTAAAPKIDAALSWLAQKIIATPEFQRLRFIRQNGLANLVFHGAEHSRFSHSLGVHAVARRMYANICRNSSEPEDPEWRLATAIAALSHDLGHGPFSHTLEEILGKKTFDHEEMTTRYLVEDGSPRVQAFCHALELKPDTKPFEEKAEKFLEKNFVAA
jgi:hypothetical protein